MCGINGIVSLHSIYNLTDIILEMNDRVKHRGPDSGNFKIINSGIGFGHRRLSIIDLQEIANQPMTTLNERFCITFNGEIYNYKEIKKKLNVPFTTNSDTEVILRSIELNGLDWFLQNANGMFAFAIYDKSTNSLLLARDRFGEKPLYYYHNNDMVIFSSEIKAILSTNFYNCELNQNALDDYLGYRYVREPNTFFKGINQVESGTYIKFNSELNKTTVTYWNLPEFNKNSEVCSEFNLIDELESNTLTSLELRQISDVPIGYYLSGGLDSSLLCAMASRKNNIKTYSVGTSELNEFEYSDLVSKQINSIHSKILIDNKEYLNLENWKELIYQKDAPLGVPNEILLAKLSKHLKKDISVIISGEGADELLGGYGKIFKSPFDYDQSNKQLNFYSYFIQKYEYISRKTRSELLIEPSNYRDEFDSLNLDLYKNKSHEELVYNFFYRYHIKGLLQRLDTTTMLAGVEARVPFLDHKLVEFAYSKIPSNLKVKWASKNDIEKAKKMNANAYSEIYDIPKYPLKKIGEKYLPESIVYRKKIGFPVPLNNWNDELIQLFKIQLVNSSWINKDFYKKIITKEIKLEGLQVWMLINLDLFLKKYFIL
jgi:asparagine synthase (glutamine-hydrolysing)